MRWLASSNLQGVSDIPQYLFMVSVLSEGVPAGLASSYRMLDVAGHCALSGVVLRRPRLFQMSPDRCISCLSEHVCEFGVVVMSYVLRECVRPYVDAFQKLHFWLGSRQGGVLNLIFGAYRLFGCKHLAFAVISCGRLLLHVSVARARISKVLANEMKVPVVEWCS